MWKLGAKLKKYLTNTLLYSISLLVSFGIAIFMFYVDPIDPLDELDQTSSVGLGLLIFLVLTTLTIGLISTLFFIKKINFFQAIKYFLEANIFIFAGVVTGTQFKAMSKTPLYYGLYGGDLGVTLQYVDISINEGWVKTGYPPLWSAIVGEGARFSGESGMYVFKYLSILSIPIFALITLFLCKLAFESVLAEFLAIFFTFQILEWAWKDMGSLWLVLSILILVRRIQTEINFPNTKGSLLWHSQTLFLGFIFSIAVLLYSGRLWWILIALIATMFASNFVGSRRIIQDQVTSFIVGSSFLLIPFFVDVQLKISGFDVLPATKLIIVFSVALILTWTALSLKYKRIAKIFAFIFINIAIIAGIASLSTRKLIDKFIYSGVFGNPLPVADYLKLQNLLIFTTVLIIGLLIIGEQKSYLYYQITLVTLFIPSALFSMLPKVANMAKTENVALWPRAKEVIVFSISFLFILLTYVAIKALIEKYFVNFEWPKISLVILLFVAQLLIGQKLGEVQWGLYPRADTYANYSYDCNFSSTCLDHH